MGSNSPQGCPGAETHVLWVLRGKGRNSHQISGFYASDT